MGFDLYGLKPNNPNNAVRPEHLDWSDEHTDKEKTDYFTAVDAYEAEVVGHYFRNNVWWWRPLWTFVIAVCDDFLTTRDINGGQENGGHKISKTKAKRIAARIRKMDKTKVLDGYAQQIMDIYRKAEKHNKVVRKEMDAVSKACKEEHGEHLVPADYPEPYNTQWNEAFEKEDWSAHYPFNADNAREFAKFCDNSGGFEIC